MNLTKEEILEKNGWTVVCESPFEIEYEDGGSRASGLAAELVVDALTMDASTYSYLPNGKMITDIITKHYNVCYGTNGSDDHLIERIIGAKLIIKSLIYDE